MSTNTERDELAELLANTRYPNLVPAWPERADLSPVKFLSRKEADAILSAGYRKPRSIESPQELDSLPFGSVVLDFYEVAWTCSRRRVDGTLSEWLCTEFSELVDSHYVLQHGPVTVLHTPEPTP